MSVHYAWEKLYSATQYLASSNEDICKRAYRAFSEELILLTIHVEEVPESMLHELQAMQKEVMHHISTEEAQNIAKRIVDMFCEICKYYYQPREEQ